MIQRKILLVEDNPGDQALMRRALRRSNLQDAVAIVADGSEAIDYLHGKGKYAGRDATVAPSVVLLDLNLPGRGGIEILEMIRRDSRTCVLPVVVLTSSKQVEDVHAAYGCGANSYIRKPLAFEKFTETVRVIAQYWLEMNEPPSEA